MKITLETAGKIEGIEIFGEHHPETTECEIQDVFSLFALIIAANMVYGETTMIIDNGDGPIEYTIKRKVDNEKV